MFVYYLHIKSAPYLIKQINEFILPLRPIEDILAAEDEPKALPDCIMKAPNDCILKRRFN